MKLRLYKPAQLIVIALLAIPGTGFAQQAPAPPTPPATACISKANDIDFQLNMDDLGKSLKMGLKELGKNLSLSLNDIAPKISAEFDNASKSIDLNINPNISIHFTDGNDLNITSENEGRRATEKVKNYSKTYPIDGNDRIRLSNQYGKILVNTWDRHEVKVDVEIKAEADNDEDAQKLIDGVQIRDSKNGDQVYFKTEIDRSNNGSWSLSRWLGNKKHKLNINYTVYMPAKTDLGVEQSYGSILLPDLSGVVKIVSSYGSVSAQNLSNSSNDIQGSYGSLKLGVINGARLQYSYGSVDIDEVTNLKADLSYGSFKLGTLRGSADFDLSYSGGFKIDEIANSFNKLTVDASYSSVALGVPSNNNFDFDITTTYGGFSYNDSKVNIASKTPSDSRHYNPTKNYKGHYGSNGGQAQIIIHSTYGGVNFE